MFQQNRLNVNHNNNASNHHISDLKSDIVRLVGSTAVSSNGGAGATSNNNNNNERITSAASNRATSSTTTTTKLQRHSNNYLINSSNNNLSKQEEPKSHAKLRASNFHSLSQHSQQQQQVQNNSQDMNHSSNNQRSGQHQLASSATNPQIHQGSPPQLVHANQTTTTSSRSSTSSQQTTPSKPASELGHQMFNSSAPRQRQQQPTVTTTSSSSSASNFLGLTSQLRDDFRAARHSALMTSTSDHQQERETNEVVTTTMIKEELENDINSLKESELETLGSLERALPIEVSFLLRQQAYCMAKMNYLDRQLRELKEAQHQAHTAPRATSSSTINNNNIKPSNINLTIANAAAVHSKNGNFIPSDDSGGEYSRATISDDDELSSLLDQIAKSVRPDQSRQPAMQLHQRQPSLTSRASIINHQQQLQHQQQQQQMLSQQHQQRFNYSVISNQPPQQYTIINPNQLHHHQAVPVFVMSSPITVAHPSSISSNVLPGVHFQPEPRYNQYYEDFFVQNNNNSTPSTIHRHSNSNSNTNSNGNRSHQFDSSMTAIEQLVSQKEKRQIKSQLKSADNWLKMHSSGLCTINGQNFSNTSSSNANFNNSNGAPVDGSGGLEMGDNPSDRNIPSSTSTLANGAATSTAAMATENSNSVIEETRNSR